MMAPSDLKQDAGSNHPSTIARTASVSTAAVAVGASFRPKVRTATTWADATSWLLRLHPKSARRSRSRLRRVPTSACLVTLQPNSTNTTSSQVNWEQRRSDSTQMLARCLQLFVSFAEFWSIVDCWAFQSCWKLKSTDLAFFFVVQTVLKESRRKYVFIYVTDLAHPLSAALLVWTFATVISSSSSEADTGHCRLRSVEPRWTSVGVWTERKRRYLTSGALLVLRLLMFNSCNFSALLLFSDSEEVLLLADTGELGWSCCFNYCYCYRRWRYCYHYCLDYHHDTTTTTSTCVLIIIIHVLLLYYYYF